MAISTETFDNFGKELLDKILTIELLQKVCDQKVKEENRPRTKEEIEKDNEDKKKRGIDPGPWSFEMGIPPKLIYYTYIIEGLNVIKGNTPYSFEIKASIKIFLIATPILIILPSPTIVEDILVKCKIGLTFFPIKPLGIGYTLTAPMANENDIEVSILTSNFTVFDSCIRSAVSEKVKKQIDDMAKDSSQNFIDLLSKFQGAVLADGGKIAPILPFQALYSEYENNLKPDLVQGIGIGAGNATIKTVDNDTFIEVDWVIRNLKSTPLYLSGDLMGPDLLSSSDGAWPAVLLPGMKKEFRVRHYNSSGAIKDGQISLSFSFDGKQQVWHRTIPITEL